MNSYFISSSYYFDDFAPVSKACIVASFANLDFVQVEE